jgi:hypothetical protein
MASVLTQPPKVEALPVERGKVYEVTVAHDSWCALLTRGGTCNCDPEVTQELLS